MASILAEPALDMTAASTGASVRRRVALATLAACIAWTIACYGPAALEMVRIWSRSTTFNHGFVVPPLALWLAWQRRRALAEVPFTPAAWPLAAVGILGVLAVAGVLARVNVIPQFALVATIVLTIPAVLGWRAARVLAFPLAFLLFALPVGDFMLPRLMDWTADFTIAALRATGIPVYRQGLVFVIPSGTWSVVEACSGVRYLIASLMVGTLYASVIYRSPLRRALFMGCSAVVPIVANWMRAYLIVLLGHVSNNRIAVGVDHLIYGWIFFGLVIGAMFAIGARWREDQDDARPGPAFEPPTAHAHRGRWAVPLVFAMLVAVAGLAQWRVMAGELAPARSVALDLAAPPGWVSVPPRMTTWAPRFHSPSAVMQLAFAPAAVAGAPPVGVYIAYYRQQTAARKLVSTDNALVRSDDPDWSRTTLPDEPISLGAHVPTARAVRIVSTRDQEDIHAWQFYWIDGHVAAGDVAAKVWTAWSELTSGRDDSAVVIVHAQGDAQQARRSMQRFLADAGPALLAMLDAARQ